MITGGYIFDLDDPASLGRILQGLTRDDLARLGSTARARWEQNYNSDRMNQLTCEAYEALLPLRQADKARRVNGVRLEGCAAE